MQRTVTEKTDSGRIAVAAMDTGACIDSALGIEHRTRARPNTRAMHFSKTYAQLLLTLPPELRESAIQYRQLKKIINQIVAELTSLGQPPPASRPRSG